MVLKNTIQKRSKIHHYGQSFLIPSCTMSFSFGFFNEAETVSASSAQEPHTVVSATFSAEPVVKHPPLPMFLEGGDIEFTAVQIGNAELLMVVNSQDASALDKETDIIPGVYEGGYKVWECSVDLTAMLLQKSCTLPELSTCRAIELGCGHGFPGVAALKLGCPRVVFSDLNAEVINGVTWPNIFLNARDIMNRVECYSGDWDELSSTVLSGDNGKFDLILSAETLYTEASCNKILTMILRHLSDTGVALIASKRFYFGVGGGTYTLETLVQACGVLNYQVEQVYQDGASNIREIVRLTRK